MLALLSFVSQFSTPAFRQQSRREVAELNGPDGRNHQRAEGGNRLQPPGMRASTALRKLAWRPATLANGRDSSASMTRPVTAILTNLDIALVVSGGGACWPSTVGPMWVPWPSFCSTPASWPCPSPAFPTPWISCWRPYPPLNECST